MISDVKSERYLWIPFHHDADPDPEREAKRVLMNQWSLQPSSQEKIVLVKEALDRDLEEKCFWDFLNGGDPKQLSFEEKIRICAKYRLEDVRPEGLNLIIGSSDQLGVIRWHHFPHTHPFIRFDQLLKRLDNIVEAADDQLDKKRINANQQKRLRLLQQLGRSNAILREVKSLKHDLNASLEMDDQLSAWLYRLEVRNAADRDLSAGDLHNGSSIVARLRGRGLKRLSSAGVFDIVLEEIRSSHGKLSLVLMRPSHEHTYTTWKRIKDLERMSEHHAESASEDEVSLVPTTPPTQLMDLDEGIQVTTPYA